MVQNLGTQGCMYQAIQAWKEVFVIIVVVIVVENADSKYPAQIVLNLLAFTPNEE